MPDRASRRRIESRAGHDRRPDLSLVMPSYNEERVVRYTAGRLMTAFRNGGYRLELVAVDNGSTDRTGEILAELAAEHPGIRCVRIEKNEGYGNGILTGLPACTAPWVGIIPADGQVDAEDVVRLFDVLAAGDGWTLGKLRRRFRMDGPLRKVVSIAYNLIMRILWPGLGTLDVNGNPKILPRSAAIAMQLGSKGWLLDPEMMIKAQYLGLKTIEFNVFARMRSGGTSHVRANTVWEFVTRLFEFRFSGRIAAWRRGLPELPELRETLAQEAKAGAGVR